jgi:hypothetical protein
LAYLVKLSKEGGSNTFSTETCFNRVARKLFSDEDVTDVQP